MDSTIAHNTHKSATERPSIREVDELPSVSLVGNQSTIAAMQDGDAVQAASQRGFRLRLVDDKAPLVVRSAGCDQRQSVPGRSLSSPICIHHLLLLQVGQTCQRDCTQILLGWFGARDKTLAKYGSLVTSLGYSHLRAILPSEHVLWPYDGGRVRFARLVLDFLLETGLAGSRQALNLCA